MEEKKTFKEKCPIIVSLLVIICFLITLIITQTIGYAIVNIFADYNDHLYLIQAIEDLFGIGFGLLALHILKINGVFKEHKVGFFKGLFVSMYFMVVFLILIISNILTYFTADVNFEARTLPQIISFILAVIFIGAAEEITMRGVVFNLVYNKYGKDRAGVWLSVIISGILFGLFHLPNAGGIAFSGVLIQFVLTMGMGMTFSAIYLRTKNIWLVIFIHAFNDFLALIYSGIFDVTTIEDTIGSYNSSQVIYVIPYLIVTFVLLRNSKLKEILGTTEIKSTKKSSRQFALWASILAIMIVGGTVLSTVFEDNRVLVTSFNVKIKEDSNAQYLSVEKDGTYTLNLKIENPENNCVVSSYITEDGKVFEDIGICEYMNYSNEYDMMANKVYKIHFYKIKTESEFEQFIKEKNMKFDKDLLERYHEILPEENDEECEIKCSVKLYQK